LGHSKGTSCRTPLAKILDPPLVFGPVQLLQLAAILSRQFASITCLEHGDYSNTDISQGAVATCFRCGGIFECDFVTNFASESNSEKILKIA